MLLIAAAIAFTTNLILTRFIIRLSHKKQWFDHFDDRKIHTEETPRLGGVGFFLSFIITVLVIIVLQLVFPGQLLLRGIQLRRNLLLFLGLTLIHGLGLYDDFRPIRAIYKLVGQIAAGIMMALGGALMDGIYLPVISVVIPLGPFSGAVTVFWIISISNAVNLIDGLDGLAGGTSLIAALAIGAVHIILGNFIGALYSFILGGAVLGFLFYNRPRAKIFMGDSGSLFLGFILGALVFIGGDGAADEAVNGVDQFLAGFVLTITLLIVPIIDMISAILRRLREGKPIHHPDKEHLHHKLLGFGFSTAQILAIVHSVNLAMAVAVIAWAINNASGGAQVAGDLILIAAWTLAAALSIWLHYANRRRKSRASASN